MVDPPMNALPQSPSTDTAFRVLADHRRRQISEYLADSDGTATLDHLVAALLAACSSS